MTGPESFSTVSTYTSDTVHKILWVIYYGSTNVTKFSSLIPEDGRSMSDDVYSSRFQRISIAVGNRNVAKILFFVLKKINRK